nr:C40 family peptidase [Lachnospiraceae bacterium]
GYADLIFTGEGMSAVLNRLDFVEKIYEYDRNKYNEYVDNRNKIHELWDTLVMEKEQLEAAKNTLEEDKKALESAKAELDVLLARKKRESDNYDAEIAKAKAEASAAQKKLKQEQKTLKNLEAQEAAKAKVQTNMNTNYAKTSYTGTIDSASGSSTGKQIAKYACQFIGNAYVYGGTSLTSGTDCSGFTYRVYKDFGYNLPRTSFEQQSVGTGVSLSEAQPGDLVCYSGHVGLYIGDGKIVHASSVKTGIKVSNATYKSIVTIRRVIN